MIFVGQCLDWGEGLVLDKYCVGGLLGNCIILIVVVIVVVLGYCILKILLCVIMLFVGIVDIMEVMVLVVFDLVVMCWVVECEGGCIVWGGNVCLSLVDDILIWVQCLLDFDSDG